MLGGRLYWEEGGIEMLAVLRGRYWEGGGIEGDCSSYLTVTAAEARSPAAESLLAFKFLTRHLV